MTVSHVVFDADQSTYHVVDFIHADQTRSKFEHVVAQGDDDELRILGTLLDVARND